MLAARRAGDLHVRIGGRGTAVLLIHGIPGQSEAWDLVARRLIEGGHQVLVPDLLGFGRSAAAEDRGLDAQADALATALRALRVAEVLIVAHDYGVPVALTLVARHDDITCTGLVAAATNLFPDTAVPLPLKLAKVPGLRWALWPLLGTRWGAKVTFRAASGKRRAGGYALARQSAASTFWIFCRSISDLARIYAPVERSARSLKVPSVVVWGARDPFFPVAVGARSAEALQCELVILEDVGHFIPEEAPEAMVSAAMSVKRGLVQTAVHVEA